MFQGVKVTIKKKKDHSEYSFHYIKVDSFQARIGASINYEVRDKHHYRDDAMVHDFSSALEIEGEEVYSDDDSRMKYEFTVYGSEPSHQPFSLTLDDCHVRDEDSTRQYRKVRGRQEPIYDVPKGIGHLERQRGKNAWLGWLWVNPETVSQMLSLMPHVKPLYIEVHRLKIDRQYWIVGFTLQSNDPSEE